MKMITKLAMSIMYIDMLDSHFHYAILNLCLLWNIQRFIKLGVVGKI